MALDHPGHQRGAGKVDRARARGRCEARTDGRDAVAFDEHAPALVRHLVTPSNTRAGRTSSVSAMAGANGANPKIRAMILFRTEPMFPKFALIRVRARLVRTASARRTQST